MVKTPKVLRGEEQIIQDYLRALSDGWPGAYGLRDDCATLQPAPGHEIVIKTDPIRAGVHFFADDHPADIAWKALAVNVSDLASKAARPVGYTLALSFPEAPSATWLEGFSRGLGEAQRAFGCHLIGGDTDRAAGPLSLAITAFGECPVGRMVRRVTARVGDRIFVSGSLGEAAIGLRVRQGRDLDGLSDHQAKAALDRYLRPQPRLGLLRALRGAANAAMDLSDGLAKDLGRMCRSGGVGAYVRLNDIPISKAALAVGDGSRLAARPTISAGDDYEILCTVPEGMCDKFVAASHAGGVNVAEIGSIIEGDALILLDESGSEVGWGGSGYDHF